MYSETVLRRLPCYHCIHCVGAKEMRHDSFMKRKCALTNRWGSMDRAFCCTKFENKCRQSSVEEFNGYRIRKDQVEDYRTARQWADDGYRVRCGVTGIEMYATRMAAMNNGRVFTYYLPEQVEKEG